MHSFKFLTRCLAIIALICVPTLHGAMYDFVPNDECMPESRTVKLFDLDANKDVTYLILQYLVGFDWDLDDISVTHSNLKTAYQNYLPLLLVSKKMRAMIFLDYKPLTLSRWEYWSKKIAHQVRECRISNWSCCTRERYQPDSWSREIKRLQKQLSLLNFITIADNHHLVPKGTTTPLHMAILFISELDAGGEEFFIMALDAATKKFLKKTGDSLDRASAQKQLLNRRDQQGNTVLHTACAPFGSRRLSNVISEIESIVGALRLQDTTITGAQEFAPQLYKDIESEYISPQKLRKHLEEAEWPNGYANDKGQVPGGLSPFLAACLKGDLEKIKVFIEVAKDRPEINLNAQDLSNRTVLSMLINQMGFGHDREDQQKMFDVLNLLLNAIQDGAAIDLTIPDGHGNTPLHNAVDWHPENEDCASAWAVLIERMIEVAGPQSPLFYTKNTNGHTPLHHAIIKAHGGQSKGLAPFIKAARKGYDIALNERSSDGLFRVNNNGSFHLAPGHTALHLAVQCAVHNLQKTRDFSQGPIHLEMIKLLVSIGADDAIKDDIDKTAYDYAKGLPMIWTLWGEKLE